MATSHGLFGTGYGLHVTSYVVMAYGLRGYRLHLATGYGLRAIDYGLWVLGYGLRAMSNGLRAMCYVLWAMSYGFRAIA